MMYIQQERLRLICQGVQAGIDEAAIEKLLNDENVSDYYLENLKIRLGIIEKKPERAPRKTVVPPTAATS